MIQPGEQDFSLSLAIQRKYRPRVLVATSYDALPKNRAFWDNIKELEANGAIVAFKIDARKLETSLHKAGVEGELQLTSFEIISQSYQIQSIDK